MQPLLAPNGTGKIAPTRGQFGRNQEYLPLDTTSVDAEERLMCFRRRRDAFRGSTEITMSKAWTSTRLGFPKRFIRAMIFNISRGKVHGIDYTDRLVRRPACHVGGTPYWRYASSTTGDRVEACALAGTNGVKDMLMRQPYSGCRMRTGAQTTLRARSSAGTPCLQGAEIAAIACCATIACMARVGCVPSQKKNSSGLAHWYGCRFGLMQASTVFEKP